ncbi:MULTISPECIES: hypothetical protein [unclassified Pseudomonas]|jgi:hypothetical protein|uniref:hypothetical protein n=1 Tax=unclassified Pseudomonas TaxID=196821 RepID=UPI00026F7A8A|nr:hypothetical protein [Pseudomonas sp. GM80]EJN29796.1 hypothetical protein PMI37_03161 [Pseudomonas sp. GM80]
MDEESVSQVWGSGWFEGALRYPAGSYEIMNMNVVSVTPSSNSVNVQIQNKTHEPTIRLAFYFLGRKPALGTYNLDGEKDGLRVFFRGAKMYSNEYIAGGSVTLNNIGADGKWFAGVFKGVRDSYEIQGKFEVLLP